ncbi:MAG: hypothetical protein M3O35_00025 [Acidobacteriota bacterium]|nr:hypothetical protein [Acidobacteriota bacterium]
MRRILLGLIVFSCIAEAQTTILNLSHDLTSLNIAPSNMTPNTPALDSRPLFEAAVQYAQANSIPLITADPGAYYFLTGHSPGRYLSFTGLHDVAFDLAGSDFYIQSGSWTALECNDCRNVRFLNFTLDALQLPFTQVEVTSVDTFNNRIYYAPLDNWEAPVNFNTARNPSGAAEPLYAFVFRDGVPLRETGRMAIQRPIDANFLPVMNDGSPWGDPRQLANVEPGDIIALTARAGGPALAIRNGSNIVIGNVSVYFSGGVGVQMQASPDSTLQQVQVIPRPGTDRLVSTNADGISAFQLGRNLSIRRSRVRRTGDDGMSPNSQQLAIVTGQPDSRHVSVNRSAFLTFPDGLAVQFIDNHTGIPLFTGAIRSQDPASGSATTLAFDQDLPPLAPNLPMVYADPMFRGSGLLIENNVVEEVLHARGISLWGIEGATVQHNVIRNVPWSAIDPIQRLSVKDWMTGPIANLTLQGNVIEQYAAAFGAGIVNALAGIEIESNDLNLALIPASSPFQNVTVANNFVSTGPYSGLWFQNVNTGTISGNLFMNVSTEPDANNPNPAMISQLGLPIVIAASSNIGTSGNIVDSMTPPALVMSGVSMTDDAVAPDSWAAVKGDNLAPLLDVAATDPLPVNFDGVTVTIQDSAGTKHVAPIYFISPKQINFLIPSGCALGAAVVTVASSGTNTGRGGVLIDSLAPALFSITGSGAGTALGASVLSHPDGSQTVAPLTQPVDLGQPGDVAALVLYASGLRHLDSAASVAIFAGDQRLPVQYAGAQDVYRGVDQINVNLPAQLRGAGPIALRVVVQGLSSNSVMLNIK